MGAGHSVLVGVGVDVDVGEAVTLVSVKPGPFYDFVFIGSDGPDQLTLSEDELGGIELVETIEELPFDGDGNRFRLGIEARRILTAFSTRGTSPAAGSRSAPTATPTCRAV